MAEILSLKPLKIGRPVIFLAAAVFAALPLPAAGAQRVGAAAAVHGIVQLAAVSGVREVGRKVASGEPIYLGDRITTGLKGRLQIMLLDETVFTIGPKAVIMIDEFVYDPNTSKGKIAATILKGTFRFVTGRISKRDPSKMVVRLPVGSIGIRGTSVAGHTDGVSATVVLLGPGPNTNTGERVGRIFVSGLGAAGDSPPVEIVRPGFATRIAGVDQPPSPPVRLAPAQLSAIIGRLNPPPPATEPATEPTATTEPTQEPTGDQTLDQTGDPPPPPPDGETEPLLEGGGLLEESGDTLADGLEPIKSIGDLEATLLDGQEEALKTAQFLPPPGNATTFEQLRSISSGTANFLGPPTTIFVAGNPAGSYQLGYSYNFGNQTATGGVTITVGPPFATPGTGTFPLLAGPFADLTKTGPVDITESVGPGPSPLTATIGGQATFQYRFLNTSGVIFSELAHKLTYTKGATGSGEGKLTR